MFVFILSTLQLIIATFFRYGKILTYEQSPSFKYIVWLRTRTLFSGKRRPGILFSLSEKSWNGGHDLTVLGLCFLISDSERLSQMTSEIPSTSNIL